MDERTRRLRTGGFVVGGLLLALMILFYLGGRDIFKHKITAVTSFSFRDKSVQGLGRDSAVKFRGVKIGKVSDISIHFAQEQVQVEMEIDVDSFKNMTEKELRSKFISAVNEDGLCCRLDYEGITGQRYIDFGYFPKPVEMVNESSAAGNGKRKLSAARGTKTKSNDNIEIPSVPSTFEDVLGTITKNLDRLGKIDIEGISDNVAASLRELSELLADPSIKSAISRINEAAGNIESSSRTINRVCDEERLEKLVTSVENSIAKFNKFVDDASREAADSKLPESAAAFRSASQAVVESKLPESAAAFRSASQAVVESRRELGNTLFKLNQAIDALKMLVDYLERDPSSLLNGKKKAVDKIN